MSLLHKLTAIEVAHLAHRAGHHACCAQCQPYASPGWESFPSTISDAALRPVGALWLAGEDEPTLEEPARAPGVDVWSALAPVDLALHPYNRCQVWACRQCGKPFLRYTEYGGYYEDQRIRELQPERLVGAA